MTVSDPCIVCAYMTCPLCGRILNCSHWCCFNLTGFRNTWTACRKCEQGHSSLSVAGSPLLSRKLPSVVYSPNINQIPIASAITSFIVLPSRRCNCNVTNGSTSGSSSGIFSCYKCDEDLHIMARDNITRCTCVLRKKGIGTTAWPTWVENLVRGGKDPLGAKEKKNIYV